MMKNAINSQKKSLVPLDEKKKVNAKYTKKKKSKKQRLRMVALNGKNTAWEKQ